MVIAIDQHNRYETIALVIQIRCNHVLLHTLTTWLVFRRVRLIARKPISFVFINVHISKNKEPQAWLIGEVPSLVDSLSYRKELPECYKTCPPEPLLNHS